MIIKAANTETVGRFEILTTDDEFYSYLALALLGLSLLRREREIGTKATMNRGMYYEFLETVKRIARSRIKTHKDPLHTVSRLTLGTYFWGSLCNIPSSITDSVYWKKSLGKMYDVIRIWPSKIPKKTNQ